MDNHELEPYRLQIRRDNNGASRYVICFWDADKWIEIDLTSLAKVVYRGDEGSERGTDPSSLPLQP